MQNNLIQTQITSIGDVYICTRVSLSTTITDLELRGETSINKKSSNDRFVALLKTIAQKQDEQAFKLLFAHFAPRIKTYLLGLKLAAEEVDDLVQDVFLTVWRKAHLYNAEKAFVSTWIFTIARNRFIDEKRKEGRFPEDELRFLEEIRKTETGESVFVEKQTAIHIRLALKTLSHDQQEVIKKTFLESKSHSTVAEETGLPLGTVKSRIRLAFEKMRKKLEKMQ